MREDYPGDELFEKETVDESRLELENRIKNLVWTVSGDYTLEVKPDVESFLTSQNTAIYDNIKQGAYARYLDREQLSMYLVKKVFMQAEEAPLLMLSSLCIDEAVCDRLMKEREGVKAIRKKACEEILNQDFKALSSSSVGMLELAYLREVLDGSVISTKKNMQSLDLIRSLKDTENTSQVIRVIDALYNQIVEPDFEKKKGSLSKVLAVTLDELKEYSWQDYLSEEMYEENLEVYLKRINESMATLDIRDEKEEPESPEVKEKKQKKVLVVDEAALEKMNLYVQLNYGKSYLTPQEEKSVNNQMCRGIHDECSLYFTEGILRNPVKKNYQLEYARKLRDKNRFQYHDNHWIVKRNIRILTDMLKRAMMLHDQQDFVRSDAGVINPSQMWKVGRCHDPRLFIHENKQDSMDFVVDVLIDASGSQRKRQGQVAIQAYTISETLSNLSISHRVTSYCTFWDYTVLQRFRDYEDDRKMNERIFDYMTSANNRDGLAVKAVGSQLSLREEEHKILIVLSDGKPYDVVVNRPGNKNPMPYKDKYAISDTAMEVRKLRGQGISVLGVFAGEEQDLSAERMIFGKDFAYIRDITEFPSIVGRYLVKQIE
ncbi:nitric oxide reductase activation protein [Blautia liquoris]|uniref:Nitric oxide reductase activation protein n=1 Tax=Blautia liquoris TaxID=2779518 RepID=A0A7M2RJ39_9FIRM|nr:nitric oxide reductase activation protein [Blautia liquoris]QOV20269.1 nitric oxide reductase activation protein [Blautia liquoris]